MKRDIRHLFRDDNIPYEVELPKGHREEFLNKLKTEKPKSNNKLWLKIAVVFVVGLGLSYTIWNKSKTENASPMVAQIAKVEQEYLQYIDTEWHNFLALTTDKNLVKRYEEKLADLDTDYQEISRVFQEDTNNIMAVELLIDNLQTRLQLLKDIQEHIHILNQKTEQNEQAI